MSLQPTDAQRRILWRVLNRQPLRRDMGDDVIALVHAGYLTSTPSFDRTEVCPYRVSEAAERALRARGEE